MINASWSRESSWFASRVDDRIPVVAFYVKSLINSNKLVLTETQFEMSGIDLNIWVSMGYLVLVT